MVTPSILRYCYPTFFCLPLLRLTTVTWRTVFASPSDLSNCSMVNEEGNFHTTPLIPLMKYRDVTFRQCCPFMFRYTSGVSFNKLLDIFRIEAFRLLPKPHLQRLLVWAHNARKPSSQVLMQYGLCKSIADAPRFPSLCANVFRWSSLIKDVFLRARC